MVVADAAAVDAAHVHPVEAGFRVGVLDIAELLGNKVAADTVLSPLSRLATQPNRRTAEPWPPRVDIEGRVRASNGITALLKPGFPPRLRTWPGTTSQSSSTFRLRTYRSNGTHNFGRESGWPQHPGYAQGNNYFSPVGMTRPRCEMRVYVAVDRMRTRFSTSRTKHSALRRVRPLWTISASARRGPPRGCR